MANTVTGYCRRHHIAAVATMPGMITSTKLLGPVSNQAPACRMTSTTHRTMIVTSRVRGPHRRAQVRRHRPSVIGQAYGRCAADGGDESRPIAGEPPTFVGGAADPTADVSHTPCRAESLP